jgi:tetratricopeptide (TPR) repeat protein
MAGIRCVLSLPLLLMTATAAIAQPVSTDPEEAFTTAISLMESGKFAEAVPILESLSRDNKTANILWNLGIAASESGLDDKALSTWLEYRQLSPEDWRGRAKLIQAYQATGDLEARDDQRAKLFRLWEEGKDTDLSSQTLYCREQIIEASRRVFVFEYFHPTGDNLIFYSFQVRASGSEDFKISLGSYEGTSRIAWETGKLKRDQRLYHLDLYRLKRHETYAFYEVKPSYETVRKNVMSILAGELEPVSSTTYP